MDEHAICLECLRLVLPLCQPGDPEQAAKDAAKAAGILARFVFARGAVPDAEPIAVPAGAAILGRAGC